MRMIKNGAIIVALLLIIAIIYFLFSKQTSQNDNIADNVLKAGYKLEQNAQETKTLIPKKPDEKITRLSKFDKSASLSQIKGVLTEQNQNSITSSREDIREQDDVKASTKEQEISSLPKDGKKVAPKREILVEEKFVGEERINDTLKAIGTGRALHTVTLTSRHNGILQKIYVRSGDRIKKGAFIAQLDDKKESIELQKEKLIYANAQTTLARLQTLRASNAISVVQYMEAKLALQNAQLALNAAQLAFNERKIISPIDGVVGIFSLDFGNYVTPNTPLVRIDDLSKLLIDIWIPERFVPFLSKGALIKAVLVSDPKKVYNGSIVAIDNSVDDKSRTLHVRAILDNSGDKLRPGMSFEVTLNFIGDAYLSIDPLALQWRSGGPYVWKIENGKAKAVLVNIIQRNASSILIKGKLKKGDAIIVKGAQNVHEGSLVKIENADSE